MSEKISPRAKFGIKVRLQAAFGAVAITTVIAAAVAIMSFSETERGFERVSTREVPMMTDALRLSVASGEISAAAARYVSAKTSDDRKLIAAPDRDPLARPRRDHGPAARRPERGRRLLHRRADGEAAEGKPQGAGAGDLRAHRHPRQPRSAARRAAPGAQQDQRQAHPDRRRQLFRGRDHRRRRRPERRHHGAHAHPGRLAGDAGDGRGRRRDQSDHRPAHVGRAHRLARHPGDAGGPLHRLGAARREASRQASGRHQVRAAEGARARPRQARGLQAGLGRERDAAPHEGVPRARATDQPADHADRRPQLRRGDAERGGREAHQQAGEGPRRGADHGIAQRARSRGPDAPRHQPAERSGRRQGQRFAGTDAGPLQGRDRPARQGGENADQRGDQGRHRRVDRLWSGRQQPVRTTQSRTRRDRPRRQDNR